MIRNKFITGFFTLAASLALTASAAAQDFGFGEPAASGDEAALASSNPLEFSGSVSASLRTTFNQEDLTQSTIEFRTGAMLAVKATYPWAEGFLALKRDSAEFQAKPIRVIDQAYVGFFSGPMAIRLGLIKATWGKGDDVHVLDVINPFDYTDFINQPYADRKIPQPTLKMDISTSDSGKLELVYLPVFGADSTATEGFWVMKRISDQLDMVYAQTYGSYIFIGRTPAESTILAKDAMENFIVQPDGNRLDMGQAGLRFTETVGSLDYGLQYWYGFLREPVYNANPVAIAAAGNHVLLDYNRAHRFGADFAFALGSFNFRGELAYDMTEDFSGDMVLVHNPALGWSVGADAEFLGFRLNVQNLGRYTLFTNKITDAYDVETGIHALSNTIIADLSRSMPGDKLVLRASGAYSVENSDYAIMPGVEWSPVDNATLKLKGTLFGGEAGGVYSQFADNSFVEASLTVNF